MQKFTVYGLIATALFQKCSECAEYVNKTYGEELQIEVVHEMPRDFDERKEGLAAEGKLEDPSVVVVVVDESGSVQPGEAFLQFIQAHTTFRVLPIDPAHPDSYENRALFSWHKFLRDRGNSYCWMTVKIGDEDAGKITFELYSKLLPRTSTNFWRMCCGRGGTLVPEGETEPYVLSYKGTTFFRILKGAWIMGGDVSPGHTGTGGFSCYGRHFPDESFAVRHHRGILGMCNDGEHSNASSFYITMSKMSWMNGKYVAFGRVMDGMKTVEAIHNQEVKHSQAPVVKITIEDCGVLDVKTKGWRDDEMKRERGPQQKDTACGTPRPAPPIHLTLFRLHPVRVGVKGRTGQWSSETQTMLC
eukprot:gene10760-7488_t